MKTSDMIFKSLVELKLQLYYDEINGQTFIETANTLREMYLKSGRKEDDFLLLNDIAEEEYKHVLITLERKKRGS